MTTHDGLGVGPHSRLVEGSRCVATPVPDVTVFCHLLVPPTSRRAARRRPRCAAPSSARSAARAARRATCRRAAPTPRTSRARPSASCSRRAWTDASEEEEEADHSPNSGVESPRRDGGALRMGDVVGACGPRGRRRATTRHCPPATPYIYMAASPWVLACSRRDRAASGSTDERGGPTARACGGTRVCVCVCVTAHVVVPTTTTQNQKRRRRHGP